MISHLLDHNLDSNPAAIGREIRLNDRVLTIVGITREEFAGLNDAPPDLWVPITIHGEVIKQDLFGTNQPREVAITAGCVRE